MQVSISVEQPDVRAPYPARVVLHFHNSGSRTLWLYKPAVDSSVFSSSSGGSSLAVHLEPVPAQKVQTSSPASAMLPAMGMVLRIPGFFQPQLIALQPGGNTEENVVIDVVPATLKSTAGVTPLWGGCQMIVAYSASYPNTGFIASNLGVDLWTGSVSSNPVQITLGPPGALDAGMISGKVLDRDGRMDPDILVSLTDSQEHLLMQKVTGFDGGFSFSRLPFGRYWVTVRRLDADGNTSFFEHADLSGSQPDAEMKLIMLNQRYYEAKQVLQKPVFFRIADSSGNAVPGATLKLLWSDGTVIDTVRTETDENGVSVVDLIPGTNYVTVTRRRCPKLDQMSNVAPGGGIDGISITYDCKK